MQLKTILNRIQKHRCFVYESVRFREGVEELALEVEVRPRSNSRPICSECRKCCPGYDTLPPRYFEFVPLWGIKVFLLYARRRVDCSRCGVRVEAIPWAEGKSHLSQAYV